MSLDHLPKTIRPLLKKSVDIIRRIDKKKVKSNKGEEFVFMMQQITGEKGEVFPKHHWKPIEWDALGVFADRENKEERIQVDERICLCTKEIQNICVIQYLPTGDMFEVGIDCIEKIDKELYKEMVRLKRGPKPLKKEEILKQIKDLGRYVSKTLKKSELLDKLEIFKKEDKENKERFERERIQYEKERKEYNERWEREKPERERKQKEEKEKKEREASEKERIFKEVMEVKKLQLTDWEIKWKKACEILGYRYVNKGSVEYERVKTIFKQF